MATINDWTYEKTVGFPTIIKIEFVKPDGTAASTELTSTTWTETWTDYRTIFYKDADGKEQSTDVVIYRHSSTRSTIAAVNGAYVKWCLEKGQSLPVGDANRESETVYTYEVTSSGPRLIYEKTTEYISEVELAGSLNIDDYTGVIPGTGLIISCITENSYEEMLVTVWVGGTGGVPISRIHTKQATTRYQAMGLTQEGQQSAAKQLANDKGDGVIVYKVILAMMELMCDGTEIRTSIGRVQPQSRPSPNDLMENYVTDPYYNDPLLDDLGSGTFYDSSTLTPDSQVELTFDNTDGTYAPQTDYYNMPYSPDSVIGTDGSIIDGGAAQAAMEYGEMLTALKVGYASGFNVTTSADRLPSLPFAPLFINLQGLSISTRLNGTSWAFDASGIVASSDLLLCGVAGATGDPATSWVRLTVPIESLPVLDAPADSTSSAPASTITAPSGFDATDPGTVFTGLPQDNNDVPATTQSTDAVIAPYVLNEPMVARSRHRVLMIEQQYALSGTEAITATSRTGAGVTGADASIVTGPMDYYVIIYRWTDSTGLDTKTEFVEPFAGTTGWGWSGFSYTTYAEWADDVAGQPGAESVVIYADQIRADYPTAATVQVNLRVAWESETPVSAADVQLSAQGFSGGTMEISTADPSELIWVNTTATSQTPAYGITVQSSYNSIDYIDPGDLVATLEINLETGAITLVPA